MTVYTEASSGSGFEPWGRERFSDPSRPALRPPSLLDNGYQVFSQGIKQVGHVADHIPLLAVV
jgi:hypothetical protein